MFYDNFKVIVSAESPFVNHDLKIEGKKRPRRMTGRKSDKWDSAQEALQDLLLRSSAVEAQGLQLQDLVAAILPMAASWIRLASTWLAVMAGMDWTLPLPMMMESHWTWPKQGGIALHVGVEHLTGVALGHAAGDDPGLGVVAVEDDVHIGVGGLIPVGHSFSVIITSLPSPSATILVYRLVESTPPIWLVSMTMVAPSWR